jgi:M6 family metalloprotease-like protein
MRTVFGTRQCRRKVGLVGICTALAVGAIWVADFASAIEPPTATQLQEARLRGDLAARLEFVRSLGNDQPSSGFLQQVKAKIDVASAIAAGTTPPAPVPPVVDLPTTGSPKTLTILIDFADFRAPAAPSPAFISANLYGSGTQAAQAFPPFESMSGYYYRASERKLSLQGNVLGWYRFPNARSKYEPAAGATAAQRNQAIFDLLKAAMDSFNATHDFSQYDNNADGVIDAVTILFTGGKGNWATFWCGYEWNFFVADAANTQWDGKRVKNFVFQPFETRGTNGTDFDPRGMIHQMGHLLGVPDYFDSSPDAAPTGGIGGLDPMDGFRGNHNAFTRWALGWIEPSVIGKGAPGSLMTLNASGDPALVEASNPGKKAVAIFPEPASDPYNFFLLENRFRVGNDAGTTTVANSVMPGDGLLIWQVTAQQDLNSSNVPTKFQNDNSSTTPKLLKLVEGDGLNQIDQGKSGDLGDYYTSTKSFTRTSKPPSNDALGRVTNVSVTRISASARSMTALVAVPATSAGVVATPVITPAGGAFTAPVNNISITCGTAGATIYYTLDGSTPSTSSSIYTAPLSLDAATTVIRAKAIKAAMTDSPIASATFTYNAPVALVNGVARASQAGALGSVAYYMIDVPEGQTALAISTTGVTGDADLYVRYGSLPTLTAYDYRPFLPGSAESVLVSNPVAGRWYIMLRGSLAYSAVSLSAKYSRVVTTTVAAPVLTPGKGVYTNQVDVVMTTTTTGATIRYTTDRSSPSETSPAYTGPLTLTGTVQLRARSFLPTYAPSAITSIDYTITPADISIASPLVKGVAATALAGSLRSYRYFKFDVPADQTSLVIRTLGGTGNCDLYVNAPGRTGSALPSLSDYDYRPFAVTNVETVTVSDPPAGTWYIMLHGFSAYTGATLIADYTRVLGQVATPQFSPLPGVYSGNVGVEISCATAGATIRYTTNGADPGASSPVYSAPISISAPGDTIKAQAFADGYVDSSVASGVYTVNPLPAPLTKAVKRTGISGAPGTDQFFVIRVPSGQAKLTITTSGGTGDCDLYVREDSRPDTIFFDAQSSKTGNSESVELAAPKDTYYYILLRATKAFSGVTLLADYTAVLPVAAAPAMTPSGGTFTATPVTVAITSTTADATIRYTLDGSTPTVLSPAYTAPLSLTVAQGATTGTVVVRALAMKPGFTNSTVTSKTFIMNVPAGPVTLADGDSVAVPTTPVDSERHYKITVPAGQSKLDIATSFAKGATGDCDLFVRYGAPASRSSYDYAPQVVGNAESVSVNSPAEGDWYIMLLANGSAAFNLVALVADYSASVETVAAPAFTPDAGLNYSVQVSVGMSCATAGATIRYTTNGTDPDSSSTAYSGPIRLTTNTTIKAKAFKLGSADSPVTTATYNVSTEPPSFDPGDSGAIAGLDGAQGSQTYFKFTIPSGDTNDRLTISIAGSSGDCDLFVKFGSAPSSSSYDLRPAVVTGSNESVVVNRGSSPNWEGSWYVMLVGQQSYANVSLKAVLETTLQSVAAPVITTAAAVNPISTTAVTIKTATLGAKLYYTIDGSAPTILSTAYTVPFALPAALTDTPVTVRALAVKTGLNSSTASATYTVSAAQPTSLSSGVPVLNVGNLAESRIYFKITVTSDAADRLDITTRGATGSTGDCDMYVKRGAAPTLTDRDFRSALTGNNETISIVNPAVGEWYIMLVGVSAYTKVTVTASATGVVATPVFSPASGSYVQSDPLAVTLSSATPQADIFYSFNGTTFTSYAGPVSIDPSGDPVTLTAYASKTNFTTSGRATATYTVSQPPLDLTSTGQLPSTISDGVGSQRYYSFTVPAGDAYVTFAITGSGDCDLYVKKGGLPTFTDFDNRPGLAGSSNESVTIENPSPGAAATYYIMLRGVSSYSGVNLRVTRGATIGKVATPVISPSSQTSTSSVTVSMSCSTQLATILYTTDGSAPSVGSSSTYTYTGPFIVSSNVTPGTDPAATVVKAIAVRSLYADSAEASQTYTIAGAPSVTNLLVGVANKIQGLSDTDTPTSVYYKVTLPAGVTALTISTYNDLVNSSTAATSGSGDCDLYVRKGDLPTLSEYDQRPYITGNFEEVLVQGTPGDVFYIMLYQYAAYSGVTLEARDATGFSITEIASIPSTLSTLSAPANDYRYYKVTVPSFAKKLQFSISGGTGDCDLYAAYKHLPMPVYEYVSRNRGNSDSIVVASPEVGVWYLLLHAYGPYSGVTLNTSISQ